MSTRKLEGKGGLAYLGDGLYASYNGYQITVFAHNGVAATNRVYLEPEVAQALAEFLAEHGYQAAKEDAL